MGIALTHGAPYTGVSFVPSIDLTGGKLIKIGTPHNRTAGSGNVGFWSGGVE